MKLFAWLKAPWIIIIPFPPSLSVFPGYTLIFHLVYPPTPHPPPQPPSLCSPAVFPICDGDRRLITFSRPPLYRPNLKIAAEMSSGAWHGGMRAARRVFPSLRTPLWRRSLSVRVRTKEPRRASRWESQVKCHASCKIPLRQWFSTMVAEKGGNGQTGPMTETIVMSQRELMPLHGSWPQPWPRDSWEKL